MSESNNSDEVGKTDWVVPAEGEVVEGISRITVGRAKKLNDQCEEEGKVVTYDGDKEGV